MRRVADFLIRNWPLKLAAIVLATVLYSGLVLGQNVRTWTGTLRVEGLRPSTTATLMSDLDPVTQVRYRAPLDVGVVSPDSFRATVDLSLVEPVAGGPPVEVPVTVVAVNPLIQIVDFQPRSVGVRLDPVAARQVNVEVSLGTVPDGLALGNEQIEPSSVTVRGASSRVASVTDVIARVAIDASALNIDRDFDLIAVDANGNQVPNVQLEPQRARIRISVARELANRSLPVVPQITGQPAPGYRITSVTVEPLVVTVSGEAAAVTLLDSAPTQPIDISGRTRDLEAMVQFALPAGVSVSGSDTAQVVVTIAEETGTRTFQVGIVLEGQNPAYAYTPRSESVSVTLGGPIAALDAVDASQLVAVADMSSYTTGGGEPDVSLTFEPPTGLEVASVSPGSVAVVIAVVPTTAPPSSP
ncbi:MAG: CdaR family protein [Candidatus Limnocylindrales bacterium]